MSKALTITVTFSIEEMEAMLKNAKAGGSVEVEVPVEPIVVIKQGKQELVLR